MSAHNSCSTCGVLQQLDPVISQYRDRRFEGNQEQFEQALRTSTTVYVGNLSFYTTEEQIYEVNCWSMSQMLCPRPTRSAVGVCKLKFNITGSGHDDVLPTMLCAPVLSCTIPIL